jgi:hypothetical protein
MIENYEYRRRGTTVVALEGCCPMGLMSTVYTELEFLKRLWGLGTEEEEGYRTGPPG